MDKNTPLSDTSQPELKSTDAAGAGDDPLEQGISLEYKAGDNESIVSSSDNTTIQDANSGIVATESGSKKSSEPMKPGRLRRLKDHFNIYLLIFLLLVVGAAATTIVYYIKHRQATPVSDIAIKQQNLPAETLQELAANGVQVGDPKQVLNVQSNAVFAGTVLVKGELQIASGLKIGSGSLTLPEVSVGGTASINQLQAQSLSVSGDGRVNSLSVSNNLNVNGNGSFNGGLTTPQLSVGRLQLNGDLSVSRHLVAGGANPGRSNGAALGSGGTSSVSGSDIAGSISINTGGGAAAGCMVTVNFTTTYASTPHVVITPVGSGAAGIGYYINRSANNFSVCAASPPPSNSSFGFDYHVFE